MVNAERPWMREGKAVVDRLSADPARSAAASALRLGLPPPRTLPRITSLRHCFWAAQAKCGKRAWRLTAAVTMSIATAATSRGVRRTRRIRDGRRTRTS